MMGHDVEYLHGLDDDKLLVLAKNEGRVLLTRDLELYKRSVTRSIEAFYVEGKTEAERLAAVSANFNIPLEIDLRTSRCSICNTPVQPVPKIHILDRVEKNTYAHYDEFWECPHCKKIYWQGAHWPKIHETLRDAKNQVKRL
jgi:uncharacterized protein with PIN domain